MKNERRLWNAENPEMLEARKRALAVRLFDVFAMMSTKVKLAASMRSFIDLHKSIKIQAVRR